jgi:hypothetical protein
MQSKCVVYDKAGLLKAASYQLSERGIELVPGLLGRP